MPGTLAVRRVALGNELADMWDSVLIFVPRLIGCAGILMLGWLLARFVLRMATRLLDRVGFDQVVQRGGVGRLLARTRYRPSIVLARLAYYLLLLFTLQLAFAIWGPNPVHDLIAAVVAWLPQAFVALVVVAVAVVIANALHDLITDSLGEVSYGRVLADVVSLLVIGLGGIAAFVQTGVATTVTRPVLVALLATVAGILIVGVGGGLVKPMQARWESWLQRLASESRLRRATREAYVRSDDLGLRHTEPPATGRAPVDQSLAQVPTSPAPDGLAAYESASNGLSAYETAPDGPASYPSDRLTPPHRPDASDDDLPRYRPQDV